MIKNILVYVDGSSSSEDATLAAIKIARERGATLVGMAIVHGPGVPADKSTGLGGSSFAKDPSQVVDEDARAAGWLATFECRCQSAAVPAKVLKIAGWPAESLIAEIERHDLTLIGCKADFQFESMRDIRATREKILRHARRPVLLIPDGANPASDPLGSRVLVAYDGGPAAARALASFAASGLGKSREVHIATVGDDGAKAMETAMQASESLRTSGIKATAHSIVSVLPDCDALIEFGTKLDAGLVVMGAFAHSRIKELFSGSLTRALVASNPTPIYLQH
jgi:nucleotide-binding universal stress UspA family protein